MDKPLDTDASMSADDDLSTISAQSSNLASVASETGEDQSYSPGEHFKQYSQMIRRIAKDHNQATPPTCQRHSHRALLAQATMVPYTPLNVLRTHMSPHAPDLLTQQNGLIRHPDPQSLDLMAWLIN
ncbi:hypothetical protein JRQ81_019455 [Phrynocephalus forsythii]|uniref:Uncharacterized protein n=1 Tax=Phrynocephalus forsythii TaxID=171643 RepID=A0A9Q1AY01_9SAUR|nr:hypothetical protein JRQ81_019455 [Phrynocephalus forsythii]